MSVLDEWRFCPRCAVELQREPGRVECPVCGYVGYANAAPAAEAICFDEQARVLLGCRAFDPGKGLWDLPGGFLQEREAPVDGLRRELREETALEADELDFLGFWLEPYDGRTVLCLTWTAWVSGEPCAGDDLVELAWFEPDDLPSARELAFSHYPDALSAALRRHEHA